VKLPPDIKVRTAPLLIVAGVLVAGLLATGVVELSSTNEFCYLCHYDERFQKPWRASTHYKNGVTCKDCHFGPGVGGLVDAKWLGAKDAVIALTTGEDFNNAEIYTRAKEDKCRACHHGSIKNNVAAGTDLPGNLALKVDSLAYSHQRHDEARAVCAKCHTPAVFYNAESYMTCDSCHAGIVHKTDAKYNTPVPRADRCSACHTGRVHVWGTKAEGLKDGGVFFYNDCPANTRAVAEGVVSGQPNCIKCHPAVGAAAALSGAGKLQTRFNTPTRLPVVGK